MTQRRVVAGAVAALAALLGFVALRALGLPWWACLVVVPPAGLAGRRLSRALPVQLFARRAVFALWTLLAAAALVQTARASVFMLDDSRAAYSVAPFDDFLTHHSCYSAYYEAARLAVDHPNVYDPALYWDRWIGEFEVDLYEYPPPFLVPFRLAVDAGIGFDALRGLWFALELAIVAAAFLLLAWHIGGRRGLQIGLLAPLLLLALPTQVTLQIGNFHLAAIALALIAMVAFERERPALGGALLAFVTLSKLFPGIFVLVLLFQRRWRPLAWTAAWGAVWLALTVALVGAGPLGWFVTYQLPRIASGEAFPFLQSFPAAAAVNHSIYGIAIKLQHLGAPVGQGVATALSWLYTAVVVWVAWRVARGSSTRLGQAQAFLALAILASLRSPFVPQEYALFGPIWLLLLSAPRLPAAATAALWLLLNALVPVDVPLPVGALMLVTAVPQLVSFALVAMTLRQGLRPAPSVAVIAPAEATAA